MVLIDILLASYNGAKYIEQQILSLQAQTYRNWRLLIHDDGSTDDTILIIKRYAEKDSRIVFIDDKICFGRAGNNFMYLIKFASAHFVMFCDQDDVWFDNKICLMLQAIQEKNNNIPQIVYSNSYIWDGESGEINGVGTSTFPAIISHLLFLGAMQGCVAIFNDKVTNLLKLWEGNCFMHDHLLHLIGLSMGNVTYLMNNLMLYRRHGNNVTKNWTGTKLNISGHIHNRKIPVVHKSHYDSVKNFNKVYASLLPQSSIDIFSAYISMPSYSILGKIRMILKWNFGIYNSSLKLILKILARPYFR
ncbi:rhamnosyltransferase [Spirochaetia bacterium]|nr:rhamnosyltransferase [Spirochaetia bacterium]